MLPEVDAHDRVELQGGSESGRKTQTLSQKHHALKTGASSWTMLRNRVDWAELEEQNNVANLRMQHILITVIRGSIKILAGELITGAP